MKLQRGFRLGMWRQLCHCKIDFVTLNCCFPKCPCWRYCLYKVITNNDSNFQRLCLQNIKFFTNLFTKYLQYIFSYSCLQYVSLVPFFAKFAYSTRGRQNRSIFSTLQIRFFFTLCLPCYAY